jgi:hypothetical protein
MGSYGVGERTIFSVTQWVLHLDDCTAASTDNFLPVHSTMIPPELKPALCPAFSAAKSRPHPRPLTHTTGQQPISALEGTANCRA